MSKLNQKKRSKLFFQILEDRCLLNAHVADFLGMGNYTISIAPDDTPFGQQVSNLSSVFDQRFGADAWRNEIRDAIQTWVPHANINIGFVDDDGSAAGALGPWRGDERFGDVRVFGVTLDDALWAKAIHTDARVVGSLAGDLVFNTNADWTSLDQIRSAAIHEIGHVLGLEHSESADSVMNISDDSLKHDLSDADIEAVQSLYGQRQEDYADSEKRNDTLKRATRISGSAEGAESEDFDGSQIWLQFGDISRQTDIDYFRINLTPTYDGPMSIGVKTAGLSVADLTANLRDRDGNILRTVDVAFDGGWGVMTINAKDVDERVYVEVKANDSSPLGVGGYGVLVARPDVFESQADLIDNWSADAYQWHQNSRFGDRGYSYRHGDAIGGSIWSLADELIEGLEAVDVSPMISSPTRTVYTAIGEIVGLDEIDQYTIEIPREIGEGMCLKIEIHSLDRYGIVPELKIESLSGRPLTAITTSRGYGITQVMVGVPAAGERFLVKVAGDSVAESFRVGRYAFHAELAHHQYSGMNLIDAVLTNETQAALSTFELSRTQVAKFNLINATNQIAAKAENAAIVFEIYDQQLNHIKAFSGPIDDLRSLPNVILPKGVYHTRVSLAYDGSEAIAVSSKVTGEFLGDPIGPLAPPLIQDPLLEVIVGDSLALPTSPETDSPVVVYPEPIVTIPDTVWSDPFNMGDDWYWGSEVLPIMSGTTGETVTDANVAGDTTQDGNTGGVITVPPSTANVGNTAGTSVSGLSAGFDFAGAAGDTTTNSTIINDAATAAGSVNGASGAASGAIGASGAFVAGADNVANFTNTAADGTSLGGNVNAAGVASTAGGTTDETSNAANIQGAGLTSAAFSVGAAAIDQALLDLTNGLPASMDINHDTRVTASDALMIINFIRRQGTGPVVDNALSGTMDVNSDGRVSSLDVLRIINRISRP